MSTPTKMVGVMRDVYGFDSPLISDVMFSVPRERFVPKEYVEYAYLDTAIPIGYGQTISQPFTVGNMTQLLDLGGNERVLEIGTGSGYQAAVLSLLTRDVYTIEINKNLANKAKKVLKSLKYNNVLVKVGNGKDGWKEYAPYDRIIITAAIENKVPDALFDQLKNSGILVTPQGKKDNQILTKYEKKGDKLIKSEHGRYIFVSFREDQKE